MVFVGMLHGEPTETARGKERRRGTHPNSEGKKIFTPKKTQEEWSLGFNSTMGDRNKHGTTKNGIVF